MPDPTAIDKFSAASGLASAIGDCAKSYGIDINPICKALNLDPQTFSDIAGRISLDRLCRLLETCALIANDEAFGLRCIDYFKAGSSGPFGYGLMVAPTVLDFMRFYGKHHQFAAQRSYSKTTIDENVAEVVSTYSPLIVKRDQFIDMGMGLVLARLRPLVGSSIDLIEIGLERPKPRNPAFFREKLTKRVTFGRKINSIRVPAELYSMANPKADQALFKLMDIQCDAMAPDAPEDQSFTDQIKDFLVSRMKENTVTLAEVAAYFRVSERTLQRRLAEADTTLADLRDDVRRELAERLLKGTELSAADIADRLGYSAPSAFTRSTIRWFGKTPRALRGSSE